MHTSLSQEQRALFALVRAGLWERETDDLSPFPLSATLYARVMRVASEQTVTGIAYRGLHHLSNEFLPDDMTMMRWVATTKQIERRNILMNNAIVSLCKVMKSAGLSPMLLKGQGAATMYEHPELRECGDIDLFFPKDGEQAKARQLAEEQGCHPQQMPDGSDTYTWEGIEVEQHEALFDLCAPMSQRFLATLVESKATCTVATPKGEVQVAIPSPLAYLLLLNSHILKHAMGHGIGLRQFCDMARAYHTLNGRYSTDELVHAYRKTGLLRWSRVLHAFLTDHLGMDASHLPNLGKTVATPPWLLSMVMDGGNFGLHGDSRGDSSQSSWRRKLHTLKAFVRNSRHTMALAPAETIFNTLHLMRGNL